MIPSLLLLQSDLLERQEVRIALRRDGPALFLGAILAVAGILTIVLYLARHRKSEKVLLWFGLFTSAYGVRLMLETDIFQFTFDPVPHVTWGWPIAIVTYVFPLLVSLFLLELFPQWNRVGGWLVRGWGTWALIGIGADLLLQRPRSLQIVNNVLVIAGVISLAIAQYRQPLSRRLGPLQAGVVVLLATVLINNLTGPSFRSRPMLLNLLEPLGFLCFIAGLGTVVVRQLFDREEQLIEVNKELEVARRIQTSILPRELPASPRLTLSTRYLPMTAVAGDFYDFLVPADGAIGILIADVSGHGVPAALIASMVKLAIAAQLPHAHDPALVLAGMNGLLCGKLQGQFVSAAYLFLDLNAGVMRYAGAGHPALLALRGEDAEALSENGLLLGLFAHARYSALERELNPQTRFLLYTDGVIEAENTQDEFFGEARVIDVLRQARGATANETAELLLNRVSGWAGPRAQDDITLIVVDIA